MNFNLKKPCKNCPFNKVGAIHLQPGRVQDIVDNLLADDTHWFMCHKTAYRKGSDVAEDENGEEHYTASGSESQCAGAMIYLLKVGRPSLSMRLAHAFDMLDFAELQKQYPHIIEPLP